MILQWFKKWVVGPAVSAPARNFNNLRKGAGKNPALIAKGKVAQFPHLAAASPAPADPAPPSWPIFVISLADQVARRQRLETRLQALGLPYTILDAIDGRKGLPAACELLVDRKGTLKAMRRPMSPAEYGCAISHMIIYRKVINEQLGGAIILEDDAELAPGFAEFVRSGAYRQVDIITLDYGRAFVWKWASFKISEGLTAYRITRNTTKLTAYSVSERAAGRLLSRGLPIRRVADWPIDVSLLRTYVTSPRLAHQNDQAGSSLRPERIQLKASLRKWRSPAHYARYILAKSISSTLR